jgi:hypothetical protein
MILRKYTLHILILLLQLGGLLPVAMAQNPDKDFKIMYDWYINNKQLGMNINVNVFSSPGVQRFTQEASIRRDGINFLYKVEETDMLVTADAVLMINHHNKRIIYRKITSLEREVLEKQTIGARADSVVQKYDSVRYELNTNGQRHYTVYAPKKAINKTELWLDVATGALKKMTCYYNPKFNKQVYKADILFTDVSENKQINPEIFKEEKYIKKTEQGYKPSTGFKDYEVKIADGELN